jgi:thioredoxin 1
MNQKLVIGIVAVGIILGGIGIYSSNNSKSEMPKVMMSEKDTMMKTGSYEAYSPEKIALSSSTHAVVLFFRASWCPTCKAVDTDIKLHLKNIPSNLTILDVDYDNSISLKQKYGVTYQHTFVEVDAQGNMIKKWSGSPTLAALVSEVK